MTPSVSSASRTRSQNVELDSRRGDDEPLPDHVGRGGAPPPDRDLGGRAEVLFGDQADGRRHGGREQGDLPAPAEPASGSTRHLRRSPFRASRPPRRGRRRACCVEPERTAAEVVHDAARRSHDGVNAAVELAELDLMVLAAVDRHHAETGKVGTVRFQAIPRPGSPVRGVGVRTRTCGVFRPRSIRWSIGMAKAAVFPVPVWAWPTTSRPSRDRRDRFGLDRRGKGYASTAAEQERVEAQVCQARPRTSASRFGHSRQNQSEERLENCVGGEEGRRNGD